MLNDVKHYVKSIWWTFFSIGGFHKNEAELRQRYYSAKTAVGTGNTEIVVMIDGRFIHGGLTDRFKGITSIYHYCKDKGIPFRLHYIYPFELSLFLEPESYDWRIAGDKISYDSLQAEPAIVNDWQFCTSLHKTYLDRILRNNKGKQIHIYSNTPYYNKFFRQDFHELFKPTPLLRQKTEEIIRSIGKPYVAMVFRFQQLLGDFKETGYKTLSKNERLLLKNRCIAKVEELRNSRHADKLTLVTSDSTTFLQSISGRLDFVRTIPGKVVHMDHTTDAASEVYLKSFVDMFVLSKAEKIYLLQTGDMYHSGFAKQAAMLENVEYEEVIF